jgi:hypothetical protein
MRAIWRRRLNAVRLELRFECHMPERHMPVGVDLFWDSTFLDQVLIPPISFFAGQSLQFADKKLL